MTRILLSIVIPAYNEEKTLTGIVKKIIDVEFPENVVNELIIINDGSRDKTWEIMQGLSKKYGHIRVFSNEKNLGKSQTIKRGIIETKGDIVVVQDADFEYDPSEIPLLLDLLVKNDLDVVYGNRFGKKNKVIYWQNYWGNKALSFFSNIFTYPRIRVWIPDMEVCYKMVKGDIFREIGADIESKSMFGLEPELTAKLSRYEKKGKHLKFGVIPISYVPRTIAQGKKMKAFRDGIKALIEILVYNIA